MAFDVKVPDVGESVQEAMIHSWHVSDGDFVELDDVLLELETDKATMEIVAEASGVVSMKKAEGDTVAIGDVLASIDTNAKGSKKKEEPKAETPKQSAPEPAAKTAMNGNGHSNGSANYDLFSPAARKMAVEQNIDPKGITGTGKGGRVTKQDLVSGSTQKDSAPKSSSKPVAAKSAPTVFNGSRETERKKMSMMRRSIARHLVKSQQTAAMLTTFNEVNMQAVMDLRKKYKESFKEKHGVGLGFMGFFLKASLEALKAFPSVNAYVDGEEIVYHNFIDIGVAVSTARGLMVPVVRNVETMEIQDIERAISALAGKGREGKISLSDLEGGTFTVSNGGVFGSLMSTPILNSPQSAILGMHKIEKRPIVNAEGQIVSAPMMYLALSYDHRIVDGKEAVQFLVRIKDCIEDPHRLLLGV